MDPKPPTDEFAKLDLLEVKGLHPEAAAPSKEEGLSGPLSQEEFIAYLTQLKRDMKQYIQPDGNVSSGGSAHWVERFLANPIHFWKASGSEEESQGGTLEQSVDYDFNFGLHTSRTLDTFPYTLMKMQLLPQNSVVARRLIASRMLSLQGFEELLGGNTLEAVQWIAAALRINDLPVYWRVSLMEPAIKTFETLGASCNEQGICADVALVLCHLYTLRQMPDKALSSLERGQQAAPEDAHIFLTQGHLLNTLGDFRASAAAIERSIELGLSGEALFVHGTVLQNLAWEFEGKRKGYYTERARKIFHQYILSATPDERKVCEAYFHLAVLEALESKFEEAWQHYGNGTQARRQRLPCFEGTPSCFQATAETLLRSNGYGCRSDGCAELGTRLCGGCRKSRYCSQECQKLHWQQHKKACRDAEKKLHF